MKTSNRFTFLFFLALSLVFHGAVLFHGIKNEASKKNSSFSNKRHLSISIRKERKRVQKKERVLRASTRKKRKSFSKKKVMKKTISKNSTKDFTSKKEILVNKGSNSELARYLSKIRDSILKNKFYPRIARKLKLEGKVVVSFSINWPNKISEIKLHSLSKYDVLNQSALQAVLRTKELDKMPSNMKNQTLKVEVPLTYKSI